jgi:GT2 family glycosyltransferase
MDITAVVVTYNRPQLLESLVRALWDQKRPPDRIVIVDNHSTDDTVTRLAKLQATSQIPFSTVRADENLGGAGGFALGMNHAKSLTSGWLWVMDDDACPHPDCLEILLELTTDENRLIGPAAVGYPPNEQLLCWAVTAVGGKRGIRNRGDLRRPTVVTSLPFLGLLVPTSLLDRVGVPRAEFFISGDDVDFCLRSRRAGAAIWLHPSATLYHPIPKLREFRVLGRAIWFQEVSPWRRYFEIRNRTWIALRHHGWAALALVVVGSVFRWLVAMSIMPERAQQSRAFLAGALDGLRSSLDRRPFGPL